MVISISGSSDVETEHICKTVALQLQAAASLRIKVCQMAYLDIVTINGMTTWSILLLVSRDACMRLAMAVKLWALLTMEKLGTLQL